MNTLVIISRVVDCIDAIAIEAEEAEEASGRVLV